MTSAPDEVEPVQTGEEPCACDESRDVDFVPPQDVGGLARFRIRPGERRPLLIALGVSLLMHGMLLGAVVIVMNRHVRRAPIAAAVRGDQGGDVSVVYQAGARAEPVNVAPTEPARAHSPPTETPPAPVLPAIDGSIDSSLLPTPSTSSPASASASPTSDPHPFGVGQSGSSPAGTPRGGRADSSSAPSQVAPAMTPPRVARGPGLGESVGVRGDPEGLDSRGLPIPEYPSESRHRGEEGVVELDVEVLASGAVGAIRVMSSSGYARLDTAARSAAMKATFQPASVDGQPIVAHVTIPYRFVLRQASRL